MYTKLEEITVWEVPTPNLTYITDPKGHLVAYQLFDGTWSHLDIPLKQFSTTRRKFKKSKHDSIQAAIGE